MQYAEEEPGDEPGHERHDALDEDPYQEDGAIEEERERSAVLELLEMLLSNEARDCHRGERPQC